MTLSSSCWPRAPEVTVATGGPAEVTVTTGGPAEVTVTR